MHGLCVCVYDSCVSLIAANNVVPLDNIRINEFRVLLLLLLLCASDIVWMTDFVCVCVCSCETFVYVVATAAALAEN